MLRFTIIGMWGMARWTLLATTVMACACGASSTESSTVITQELACAMSAETQCGKLLQCFPWVFQTNYYSMAQCVERGTQACLTQFTFPGLRISPQEVRRCAMALAPLSCSEYGDDTHPIVAGCAPAGTLPNDSRCAIHAQCQSKLCAWDPRSSGLASSCGTCQSYLPLGSSCVVGRRCEPGTRCAGPYGALTCTKFTYGVLGDSCDGLTNVVCGYPLICKSGTCTLPRQLGESCNPILVNDCDPTQDLRCHTTTKTCVKARIYLASGSVCVGPERVCTGSETCSPSNGASICMPPIADGENCANVTQQKCQAPATCVEGICRFVTTSGCY